MAPCRVDHRLRLGRCGAARDAQLGAALVRGVGAADGGAVQLAQAAGGDARAGRLSDRLLGTRLGAAVERHRLPSGKDLPGAAAPALREGAVELARVLGRTTLALAF